MIPTEQKSYDEVVRPPLPGAKPQNKKVWGRPSSVPSRGGLFGATTAYGGGSSVVVLLDAPGQKKNRGRAPLVYGVGAFGTTREWGTNFNAPKNGERADCVILDAASKRYREGQKSKAVDDVYDALDALLSGGKADEIRKILSAATAAVVDIPIPLALSLLTFTSPWPKEFGACRQALLAAVRARATREHGGDYATRLLAGFH